MKTLSIVNAVLCLVLVAGVCFLAVRMEHAIAEIDKLEAAHEDKIKTLSDDVSRAYTRMGEMEKRSRNLAARIDSLSSNEVAAADLEYQIKKVLGEERKKHMKRWQRQMQHGWGGLDLKPEQREAAGELVKKGFKDWMELQDKIKAGEVPKEEQGKIVKEWMEEHWAKFKEGLDEEQAKKMEDGFRHLNQ